MGVFQLINHLKEKGQSMVEVVISLGIAVIVITAILSSVLASLDAAQFSRNLNQATQYSQQGIETIQAISGSYGTGSYCLGTDNPPVLSSPVSTNCSTPNIGVYVRTVDIGKASSDCSLLTKITVTTSWSDGKCTGANKYCHNSKLVTCVSNI